MKRAAGFLASMLGAMGGPSLAAAADYWEARAAHVVAIASGGARRAEEIAGDFVRLEQAFRDLARLPAPAAATPLIVFALTADDAQRYLLTSEDRRSGINAVDFALARGFPMPGASVIVFSGHRGYVAPLRSAYAEYARSLVETGPVARYPPWYRRGLALLFSDVSVHTSQGRVTLGSESILLPWVSELRRSLTRLTVADLLTLEERDTWDDHMRADYAAQSWLLLHYAFIQQAERRELLERYVAAITAGDDPRTALDAVFGAELQRLEREFATYRHRLNRRVLTINVPGPGAAPPARVMSSDERARRLEQLRRIVDHFEGVRLNPETP